jgi:hypothetical protein
MREALFCNSSGAKPWVSNNIRLAFGVVYANDYPFVLALFIQ